MAAVLLSVGSLHAQSAETKGRNYRGELSVSVYGPAVAEMPFDGDIDWESKLGYSFGFGADYTYWFNKNIGLMAGLKIAYLTTNQESGSFDEDVRGILPVTGLGNQQVVVNVSATQSSETKAMTFAQIPVRIALKLSDFYCNVGASLSVAVTNYSEYGYSTNSYALEQVASMGVTMPTPVPLTLKDSKTGNIFQNRDLTWPVYILVGGELGYRFRFDDQNAVSLGIFGRYGGLNSKPEGGDQSFRLENGQISVNQPSATTHVDKMGYYEIGLRIAYHYGLHK
ncbi:MAG: hypothetical protein IJ620_04800 [Bacteroidales bacterium]|nr:hypothetical protein [Bacteroidales bacterium]